MLERLWRVMVSIYLGLLISKHFFLIRFYKYYNYLGLTLKNTFSTFSLERKVIEVHFLYSGKGMKYVTNLWHTCKTYLCIYRHHSVPRRPIGGKTWGQNLTTYGGIGKLPFLGKTRARDLYVTRSLKHFGSGFSQ